MSYPIYDNLKIALDGVRTVANYRINNDQRNSKALTQALEEQTKILEDLEKNLSTVKQLTTPNYSEAAHSTQHALGKLTSLKTSIKVLEQLNEQVYQENLRISADLARNSNFAAYHRAADIQSLLLRAKQRHYDVDLNLQLLEIYLNQINSNI
jgi:hypothetical protein